MKVYEAWCQQPPSERADVRVRRTVDAKCTDRELFEAMQLGDLWLESNLHEVFFYLYGCSHLRSLCCNKSISLGLGKHSAFPLAELLLLLTPAPYNIRNGVLKCRTSRSLETLSCIT